MEIALAVLQSRKNAIEYIALYHLRGIGRTRCSENGVFARKKNNLDQLTAICSDPLHLEIRWK